MQPPTGAKPGAESIHRLLYLASGTIAGSRPGFDKTSHPAQDIPDHEGIQGAGYMARGRSRMLRMGCIQAGGLQTRYKAPGAVTTCPPGGHPDMGLIRPASGHHAHPEGRLPAGTAKLLIYLSRVRVPEGALKVLVFQKEAAKGGREHDR